MISMKNLYLDSDYISALNNFNLRATPSNCSNRDWSIFKNVHIKITNNKCPICECNLDGSLSRVSNNGSTTISATIDHYRPKDNNLYPLLKCDDKNYLLMCSDCNNAYKGNNFPLHSSGNTRDTTSISTTSITIEKPLIANPIYDDLLDLFVVVLRLTPSGRKVLELEPKETSGYLYEKAKETIKLFSLGNCEVNVSLNNNVQNCRIGLLHDHFNKFYDFIQALRDKDMQRAYQEAQNKNLNRYGFYDFIQAKQFKDLVP